MSENESNDGGKTTTPVEEAAKKAEVLGLVQARVRAEIGRSKLTQSTAARQIGISMPVFNQWLNAKYKGDNAAVEKKVQVWLRSRQKRNQLDIVLPAPPAWVATHTAERIETALSFAQMGNDLAVIFGIAGAGKTATLLHYAETNSNVWVFTASPAVRTVAAVLAGLAAALDVRNMQGTSAARLHQAILEKLRGSQGLLVVDEAQHLTLETLESVRALHDASGCGLALCGNETVYARLTGGTRAANFAQLFSRIGRRVQIAAVEREDVAELAAAWNVQGAEELEVLAEIGRQPGALRLVTKTLRLASMNAASAGEPVSADFIRVAWNDIGSES